MHLERKMSDKTKSYRGRPAVLTDYGRKRNRKEVLAMYAKTEINIGSENDHWNAFRDDFNLGSHTEEATGTVTGSTMLDIGTGPTIHTIISASKHVRDIYLSDYSERNINMLKKWWKEDFTYEEEIFKYILDKENSRESMDDRNSEMKKKVKNIIGVDVSLQKPLLSNEIPATFDIIMSSLCLESASLTKEEYIQCVENIKPLINKGGSLIIVGVLNETFYKVGSVNFPCVTISKDEIQRIYKDQGFDIKYWANMHSDEYKQRKAGSEYSDFTDVFVMAAQKL